MLVGGRRQGAWGHVDRCCRMGSFKSKTSVTAGEDGKLESLVVSSLIRARWPWATRRKSSDGDGTEEAVWRVRQAPAA